MTERKDYASMIAGIQEVLKKEKIDGWLLYNFRGSNVFATRILALPPHIMCTRRYFYFIPRKGAPRKLVHRIEEWNLDSLPGEKTVYLSWKSLNEGLRKTLKGAKTIAMEYSPRCAIPYVSTVDAGAVELARRAGVKVVSSANLVQYFEARWTEEQRKDQFETADVLRKTVDVAFGFIGDALRTGRRITEYDVQQRMLLNFEENGVESDDAPNCSVNANGANPHYEPTKAINTEIKKGDYVLIDLWAKKKKPGSVFADITWVAFCGEKIPADYQKVFEIVKGSRDAAVTFLKRSFAEGKSVRGCDVDDVTRAYIRERGYGDSFIHRTGHNIGEECHGNGANIDNLETHDERVILPETCFSIEPGIYLPNRFGVRLEIDVYISRDRQVIIPGQPIQEAIVAIPC